MSDQLFFTAVRAGDPDTSHAAAACINQHGLASLILEVFDEHLGLTDDELVQILANWYGPTIKTARSRLSKAGDLIDTGERRPSNRGRAMIVWRTA